MMRAGRKRDVPMTGTTNRPMTRAIPAVGIFALLMCLPGDILSQIAPSAQQPPAPPQQSQPSRPSPQQAPPSPQGSTPPKGQGPLIVRSEAVIVPVTVKDGHGQLVG